VGGSSRYLSINRRVCEGVKITCPVRRCNSDSANCSPHWRNRRRFCPFTAQVRTGEALAWWLVLLYLMGRGHTNRHTERCTKGRADWCCFYKGSLLIGKPLSAVILLPDYYTLFFRTAR